MTDADELLFQEEELQRPGAAPAVSKPWQILVVDDEEDVHAVTRYMLADRLFQGRSLEFLHAYSAEEAFSLLRAHQNVALVLLDVVMETDDSGLLLVERVRGELQNFAVRIVLRTGQPGKAPAIKVMTEYDIDDYREKTELTLERMLVTVMASLRSYQRIETIDANRRGLKKIIEASSSIFERQSLQKLGCGVLGQLSSLLQLEADVVYAQSSGLTASGRKGESVVLAGTGNFQDYVGHSVEHITNTHIRSAFEGAQACPGGLFVREDQCAWYFQSQYGSENFLFFTLTSPLDENGRNLLQLFLTNVSLAFDNLYLNTHIEESQKEILYHITEAMECRSEETGSHVRRVAEYTYLLARKRGLPREEAERIRLASTAHDLGKIAIPDAILHKPGPLTAEEYAIIQSHVHHGYELLKNSRNPIIQTAARIALLHHEHWDGSGYPAGLCGEDIHLHGRIVAVADVFDALSVRRIYHEAWSWEKIQAYFRAQRGKYFDPELVDIVLENWKAFQAVGERYQDSYMQESVFHDTAL